uniref:Uncharacterized protein n=1 Tax=Caenorhabditis tropicalis TaxID=1561998 RepID=A0A1I7UKF6_9PELO
MKFFPILFCFLFLCGGVQSWKASIKRQGASDVKKPFNGENYESEILRSNCLLMAAYANERKEAYTTYCKYLTATAFIIGFFNLAYRVFRDLLRTLRVYYQAERMKYENEFFRLRQEEILSRGNRRPDPEEEEFDEEEEDA